MSSHSLKTNERTKHFRENKGYQNVNYKAEKYNNQYKKLTGWAQ